MVILYKECPSLSREGLFIIYKFKGPNHLIGWKKFNTHPTIFVDESYVFEAAECERLEGWGYR